MQRSRNIVRLGITGDNPYKTLREANPEAIILPYFQDAYIGFTLQAGDRALATYDFDLCIDSLIKRKGMTRDQALEHFAMDVAEVYEGRNTPLILVAR